jgi:hypothetical protein
MHFGGIFGKFWGFLGFWGVRIRLFSYKNGANGPKNEVFISMNQKNRGLYEKTLKMRVFIKKP